MKSNYEVIVQGGHVVLPHGVEKMDIGINEGVIVAMEPQLIPDGDTMIYDATDLVVMPGAIDAHVHFNEPGLASWEGFETGSASLAVGGITTYIDMPLNGVPPTTTMRGWEMKEARAKGHSYVDYAFWGGLVQDNIEELAPLANAGAAGFKAFMSEPGGEGEEIFTRANDQTLIKGMERIAEIGGVLALHAESDEMTSALSYAKQSRGQVTARDYLDSRPPEAEIEAVQRALVYAKQTGCPLHFVHISTRQAVELIQTAKIAGLDVTVETCPHYLVLTEEDVLELGAIAKCAPPLRTLTEQELLWEAIQQEQIDIIASDHSPCLPSMKETDNFFEIWGGIAGAQSTLLLMLDEGYVKRGIPLTTIARLLSANPAKRFGLAATKGEIQVGKDADLAIVDFNQGYVLNEQDIRYRHPQSPYLNRSFSCRIKGTFSRGILVYNDVTGLIEQKPGRFIPAGLRKTIASKGGDLYA